MQKLFTLTLLILFSSCLVQNSSNDTQSKDLLTELDAESVGISTQRLSRIDSTLMEYVDKRLIPGAVALIARKGKIVYHKNFGYQDVEAKDDLHTSDVFRIASMTKPVTAVAAMMLYEEGKFFLDDPVSKYIPEFKDPQILLAVNKADSSYTSKPASREVSIRHLLTHTSGIGYSFQIPDCAIIYGKAGIPDAIPGDGETLAEKMKLLAKMPLLHEPGEKFTYGLSTDMLGYLVEVISGKSFDAFLKERIFEPLEMTETYFYPPESAYDRIAPVYESSTEGVKKSAVDYDLPMTNSNKNYYSGGAGLFSTALDYAKFMQMMVNGGNYNGHQILSPKTIELMLTNQIAHITDDWQCGLGVGISDERSFARDGRSPGSYWWSGFFSTSFWIDPSEDLTAVLMLQMVPNWNPEVHQKFQNLVYQSIVQ